MSNKNPIKHFNAYDIERYHKGLLSPKERHDLEKAALDDPFLADALEGYTSANIDISKDLAELKKRLGEKSEDRKLVPLTATKQRFPWLRIAAMVVLLVGAGYLVYQLGFQDKSGELAKSDQPSFKQQNQEIDNSKVADSISAVTGQSDATLQNKIHDSSSGRDVSQSQQRSTENFANTEAKLETSTQAPITSPKEIQDRSDKFGATVAAAEEKKNTDIADARKQQQTVKTSEAETFNLKNQPSAPAAGNVTTNSGNVEPVMQNRQADAKRKANTNRAEDNSYRNYNTFRGRVIDNNNNAVPFANVTNIEDNVGTYADARGNFNLTSPDSVLNVQVKGLGYNVNSQQLRSDITNNNVVMSEDRSLNEVVISNKKPNSNSRSRNTNMKLEGEPEPEDGWDNYDSYLANNLNVPEDYKIKKTGTDEVRLSFEVNKYGEPVNIKVEKSLCGRCDQEAIRLVKDGPRWKRKAKKGRTTVTISF